MAERDGSNGALNVRLHERARGAGVALNAAVARDVVRYFRLLRRWNARMNLTALDVDLAMDRLIIEALAAAPHLPRGAALIDIASGNGSPAIPLAIARPDLRSVRLVESKARKSAFLRHVVREVSLRRVVVETARYQTLLERPELCGAHDIVTLRGIAWDADVLRELGRFVRPGGLIGLFGNAATDVGPHLRAPMEAVASHPLHPSLRSRLIMLRASG